MEKKFFAVIFCTILALFLASSRLTCAYPHYAQEGRHEESDNQAEEVLAETMAYFLRRAASASTPVFHGPEYQSKPAKEKMTMLWKAITQTPVQTSFYNPLITLGLFTTDMPVTMNTVADDMPKSGIFQSKRKKLIHSVGAVAKVKWVSNEKHPYTGSFKGNGNVLLRFSLAASPSKDQKTPGFALKFLVDGRPSSNFMAMDNLLGQKSWNLFEKEFSNVIPDLDSSAPFVMRKLKERFAQASRFPTMLSVSTVAEFEPNGKEVDDAKFPFQIVFKPTDKIRSLFANRFNDDKTNVDFVSMLESIGSDQVLYDVFARASPNSDLLPIGNLHLVSSFTASEFGDKTLFFQHVAKEKDFEIHPEWKKELNLSDD